MELIDKIRAAVASKIHGEQGYSSEDAECGYRDCARDILSFLDTLEVKEVDFNTAFERFVEQHKRELNGYVDLRWIARHFFVLGLNSHKGGINYEQSREIYRGTHK